MMKNMKKFISLLLIIILGVGGFGAYQANQTLNIFQKYSLNKKPLTQKSPDTLSAKLSNHQTINILLLGVDTGALKRHFAGRSDTIMILSMNTHTNKSVLMSVPRDMGVIMPGQAQAGEAKLNTAYELGGPQAIAKCVQQKVKVPLDGYAIINMGGLTDMLKAVGGVYVKSNLTFEQDWYHFKKGHIYHLHGNKALAYIRARHTDPLGDYGRQIRQRQVLKALVKKLTHSTLLLKPQVAKQIAKHVKTDITKPDAIKLALHYRKSLSAMHGYHVQGQSQDVYNTNYGLMEIEHVDPNESRHVTKIIQKNMY